MKFFPTTFFLSVIIARTHAGGDIEGEVSLEKHCDGQLVEMACSWKAKARRLRRTTRQFTTIELPDTQRELSMSLRKVDCELVTGDEKYSTELAFPDAFDIEIREADDVDDFCVFTAPIVFDGSDITGKLKLELIEVDKVAKYDDQTISINCP